MASKIKDGMFLGDQYIAADIDFIVANKVTHIINCAAAEVRNCWERIGIKYLNFPWDKSGERKLFDSGNIALQQLVDFVHSAHYSGESVLFHSVDGVDRASTCVIAYFMFKYQWGLDKVMDFLRSKRTEIHPCPVLLKQLFDLDHKLAREMKERESGIPEHVIDRKRLTWDLNTHYPSNSLRPKNDELILHHTFVNSISVSDEFPYVGGDSGAARHAQSNKRRITWIDSTASVKSADVMRSPFSKEPLPIRPPGPSYRSLRAGPGWIDEYKIADQRYSPQHDNVCPSPIPGRDHQPRSILKRPGTPKQQVTVGETSNSVLKQMSGWTTEDVSKKNPTQQQQKSNLSTSSFVTYKEEKKSQDEHQASNDTIAPPERFGNQELKSQYLKASSVNMQQWQHSQQDENEYQSNQARLGYKPKPSATREVLAQQDIHNEETKSDTTDDLDEIEREVTASDGHLAASAQQIGKPNKSAYRISLEQRLFSRTIPARVSAENELTVANGSRLRSERQAFSTASFGVPDSKKLARSESSQGFGPVPSGKAALSRTGKNSRSCPTMSTSQEPVPVMSQWDVRSSRRCTPGADNLHESLRRLRGKSDSHTRRSRGKHRPAVGDGSQRSRRSLPRGKKHLKVRGRDHSEKGGRTKEATKPGTTVMRIYAGAKHGPNSAILVSQGKRVSQQAVDSRSRDRGPQRLGRLTSLGHGTEEGAVGSKTFGRRGGDGPAEVKLTSASAMRARPTSAMHSGLGNVTLHHRRPLSSNGRMTKQPSDMRNLLSHEHRPVATDIKPRWR